MEGKRHLRGQGLGKGRLKATQGLLQQFHEMMPRVALLKTHQEKKRALNLECDHYNNEQGQ